LAVPQRRQLQRRGGSRQHLHEFDKTQTLGDLSHLEFVFVAIPETPAANIVGVVAYSPASEADVRISDRCLQLGQIERTIFAIDASCTLFALDLEHLFLLPLPCRAG
jgi:hypothetical protein